MSRRLDPHNFNAEKFRWHQAVTTSPVLSLSAKAAAGLILHDLNASEGGSWRGMESMSELLGVSVRHLRRLIDELQDAKFLIKKVQKGRGKTNRYFATVPTGVVLFRAKSLEDSENGSDTPPQKRTSASSHGAQNRTPMSQKPDMDVRQYLYNPIKDYRVRKLALDKSTCLKRRFPDEEIRQQIVAARSDAFARSYLDPASWDSESRTIICATQVACKVLQDNLRGWLAASKISLTAERIAELWEAA